MPTWNTYKLKEEDGAVLITALLLLIVLTLIGIAAIMTSNVDIKLAGNERRTKSAFYVADAGVEIAPGVINYYILNTPESSGFPDNLRADLQTFVLDQNFIDEIMDYPGNDGASDSPGNNPDLRVAIEGQEVNVDVDRFHTEHPEAAPAGSFSAYEGAGLGAAIGGTAVYYRANSRGTVADDVSSTVEIVYRHIY